MTEVNLLKHYPRTKRNIDERGETVDDDIRKVARQFGKEFFDGDRNYGYGGYEYHPRFWTDTVSLFKEHYQLDDDARILDIGCAKGFMMFDFKSLMQEATIEGCDVSTYAAENSLPEMQPFITVASADDLPYDTNSFDLVISINTVHNLGREACGKALQEIQRVSKSNAFVTVDAWRDDFEKNNMLKWNLTAKTYMHVDEWKKFFADVGYKHDYWWFIAK
jgi:ubiquinone/menaquinone biosynthesis C-methylase UbiE